MNIRRYITHSPALRGNALLWLVGFGLAPPLALMLGGRYQATDDLGQTILDCSDPWLKFHKVIPILHWKLNLVNS